MARPVSRDEGLTTRGDQPLIGIATMEGAEEVVRYITSDGDDLGAQEHDQTSIQRALDRAGAWSELDDEDGPDPLDELDRLRHQSEPSPPLKL